MKNRIVNEFKNKIIDKRINIVETDVRDRNKKCLNEVRRLPVEYSIGNDYLYTYRVYYIKKKYINGEITKEQYEKMIDVIREKTLEDKRGLKRCPGNFV